MHHPITSNAYGQLEYGLHHKDDQNRRRCHSEQIYRKRASMPSPSSYSVDSSKRHECPTLTGVNYSPRKLFPLTSPALNRRNSVCGTPIRNTVSMSFDKCSPKSEYSTFCVLSTPNQSKTSSFEKYMSSFESSKQSIRNSSLSGLSPDKDEPNWSLSNSIFKTPTRRLRAFSCDSSQSIDQLLNMHFSPCSSSCKSESSKCVSFASPGASKRTAYSSPMSATINCSSTSSSHTMQSPGHTFSQNQHSTKAVPSPLNIYLHTRKRSAR